MSRSCARNCCGCDNLISLPTRICLTLIPRRNVPDTIRRNAIRSRCAGFIFACILNTNPENFSLVGSTNPPPLLRGSGLGASCKKFSRNVCTPKLLIALPKNKGVNSPLFTFSRSNGSPAISNSSKSWQS
ncbi:hypothetical protein D3C76_1166020 [compost metagenome]